MGVLIRRWDQLSHYPIIWFRWSNGLIVFTEFNKRGFGERWGSGSRFWRSGPDYLVMWEVYGSRVPKFRRLRLIKFWTTAANERDMKLTELPGNTPAKNSGGASHEVNITWCNQRPNDSFWYQNWIHLVQKSHMIKWLDFPSGWQMLNQKLAAPPAEVAPLLAPHRGGSRYFYTWRDDCFLLHAAQSNIIVIIIINIPKEQIHKVCVWLEEEVQV